MSKPPTPLEEEFHRAMVDIYRRAKDEAGYNATRFSQMLSHRDGVDVAKQIIPKLSEGFSELCVRGRMDLTVEAMIFTTPKFHSLFASEEIEICRARLEQCGYRFPASD